MLDWAPMDISNSGVITAQQGLLAHCFEFAAELSVKTGNDPGPYKETADLLLSYMDDKLWLEKEGAYTDGWTREKGFSTTISMQTHVVLELYGLIRNEERRKIVIGKLTGNPGGWLKPGSPFMLYYLFEILHRNGMDARILDEIRDIWGMMLRYDSSTCWEVFPGFYENSRTRSYCHSWSSAPGYIFIKYVLGLTPAGQGFSVMDLHVPDIGLDWCEGSIPTPLGKIYVWWSRENGKALFRAKVPEGIEINDKSGSRWDITIERYGK